MKVLLDHCVPRRFRMLLSPHEIKTTYQMGWAALKNGKLLAEARNRFDAFLTVDQNIQFQQNLAELPMPIGVMVAEDNRYETLEKFAPAVIRCLSQPLRPELVRIEADGKLTVVPPAKNRTGG